MQNGPLKSGIVQTGRLGAVPRSVSLWFLKVESMFEQSGFCFQRKPDRFSISNFEN